MKLRKAFRSLFVLFAALSLAGCGPSEVEAGVAALFGGPLLLFVTALCLRLFEAGWFPGEPARSVRGGGALVLALGLLGLPVAAYVSATEGAGNFLDNLGLMVLLLGPVHVGAVLLLWRVWAHFNPRRAFEYAQLPVYLVTIAPGFYLALDLPYAPELFSVWAQLSVVGYFAWPVTILLFVVFTIEAVRRRSR